MGKFKDISGWRFGKLTVIKRSEITKSKRVYWDCVCDCGNESIVRGSHLTFGKTLSCGCWGAQVAKVFCKHGMCYTREHRIWRGMLNRCENPKNPAYDRYGGRGIRVCESWHEFKNFFNDMGHCPESMSLDRINNDGDYCPTNCRWATQKEQGRNTRSNKLNPEIVSKIREMRNAGMRYSQILKHFPTIKKSTMQMAGRGETWN